MSIRFSLGDSGPYHNGILGISFNQEGTCFSVGLESGVRVYNSEPLQEIMRKDFEEGGVKIVEMLGRSNYLALVGGGRNPRFPPNKVLILDHRSGQYVAELEFRSEVKSVRVRKERLVVVLLNKVFLYTFGANPEKTASFDTADNDEGIAALCYHPNNALLAFPSRQEGYIQIVDTLGYSPSLLIRAHKSRIACLAFSPDGRKVASASRKGTLIRVFDTQTGRAEHELRRGSDRAIIFSFDASKICVASDKGTVHVFRLEKQEGLELDWSDNEEQEEEPSPKPIPKLNTMVKELLPKYFSSRWSFASFHINDTRFMAAFGTDKNSIVAVSTDGNYYRYAFDLIKGGDCIRQAFNKFLQISD